MSAPSDKLDPLQASPLFACFAEEERQAFIDAATRQHVPADHVFFSMGDANSTMFVICAGSVRVERTGIEDSVDLVTLEKGATFGEMSFMDGSATTASITSAEPTEVLCLTPEAVDELLRENPALAAKLWRNIALELKRRLARTNELVSHYVDLNQVLLQSPDYRFYLGGS